MQMKKLASGALLSALIALVFAACGDDHRWESGAGLQSDCSQYTTCSTCTPALGCGWCMNALGEGACAQSPDECVGTAFSWTWEATGCRVGADASAVRPDAARAADAARTPDDAAMDAPAAD